jgi:hypothetical protein
MRLPSNIVHIRSKALWAFAILSAVMCSNVFAIHINAENNTPISEQIDSFRSVPTAVTISYQCAAAIGNLVQIPLPLPLFTSSGEQVLRQLLHARYKIQGELVRHILSTEQYHFLTGTSHQPAIYSVYHSYINIPI